MLRVNDRFRLWICGCGAAGPSKRRAGASALRCSPAITFALLLLARIAHGEWPVDGRTAFEGETEFVDDLRLYPASGGGALALFRRSGPNDIIGNSVLANGEIAPGWNSQGVPLAAGPGSQVFPFSCSDGADGSFLVWSDNRVTSNSWDVYAIRIQADGTPGQGWPENGVPVCEMVESQRVEHPITPDGVGGFYVGWEDHRMAGGQRAYVQHVGPDGNPVAGWPENGLGISSIAGAQSNPHIAADGTGGVYVAWGDARGGKFLQRLLADGSVAPGFVPDGIQVSTFPVLWGVLPDGGGGVFMVGGTSTIPGPTYDLYIWRVRSDASLDSTWQRNGQPVPVTAGLPSFQENVLWTLDGQGGLYFIWDDYRNYATHASDVYVLHLTSGGDPPPGWPADGLRCSSNPGYDIRGGIVGDGAGGAYLAYRADGATTSRVMVQHLSPSGMPAPGWVSEGWPITATPGFAQRNPEVVSDSLGGAIVGWEDLTGPPNYYFRAYVQKLVPDGVVTTSVALASAHATAERVRLVWSTDGNAAVTFTIERQREGDAAWSALSTLYADGTGLLAYEDRNIEPGMRYGYRLSYTDERGQRVTPETWVEVPARPMFALHSAVPNPARANDLRVRLSLAASEPARLTLHDLAGRAVTRLELAGDEPGERLVRLPADADLAPGLYWLVLEQRTERATARVTVLR